MKRYSQGKRGDISILFKWIFGFVVGALFLLFFIRFGYTHIFQEEGLEEHQLLLHLDHELDAFGISESSSKIIPWKQGGPIIFSCNTFSSKRNSLQTDKIIFAPLKLEDTTIHAWTQRWSFPYGINNVYYLSNPKHKIILVHDALHADFVESLDLPQKFNVQRMFLEAFDSSALAPTLQGLTGLTIVFFSSPNEAIEQTLAALDSWVSTEIIVVDTSTHTAEVHTPTNTKELAYFGNEQLLGLLFAGSSYDCVQRLAEEQRVLMTEIYVKKAGRLFGKTQDASCQELLHNLQQTLNTYKTLSETSLVYEYMKKIEQQNRVLEQQQCTTLY